VIYGEELSEGSFFLFEKIKNFFDLYPYTPLVFGY